VVVDDLGELRLRLRDRDRFFPGLRSWVGFKQQGVQVPRGRRYDNHPRVSLRGLIRLAKSAIFSFSSVPLGIFYVIAAVSVAAAIAAAGFALYHKIFTGLAIPGWTSITVSACFYGALNALGIAVVGEYVLRIYEQVRDRPLYLVGRKVNFQRGVVSGERTPLPAEPEPNAE
jgi:dolichol-phosphate mannosyltransferase